jgi:MFS family permease
LTIPIDKQFRRLCWIGGLAIFSSTLSKSPTLPLYAHHLGLDAVAIGIVAAASTVVGVLTSLPAGALSDHLGRSKLVRGSLFIFASAPFLYLAVRDAAAFIAVRAYHGLATAIYGPVVLALVADWYRERRGEKMGIVSSASQAGRALAPIVGGFVIAQLSGAQAAFSSVYLICGLAGILALLSGLRLPATSQANKKTKGAYFEFFPSLKEVLTHRGILLTSAAEAAQVLAYGAVEVFLPLLALERGMNAFEAGIMLGAQVVTLTLSKPLLGRMSDQLGRKPQIIAGLAISATSLLIYSQLDSFILFVMISILFGLGLSMVRSATPAQVADFAKEKAHGSALGALSTIMDVGHTAGPILAGLLIGWQNYFVGFAAIAGILLLMAVVFFFSVPVKPKPAN